MIAKYSRQRESIKQYLDGRNDHPTADTIYTAMREIYPNISLGTIYRNLGFLAERGEILKLSCGDNFDRFDGNSKPHYHFICNTCNQVYDLKMESIDHINIIANANFKGNIQGHTALFHGICENCLNKKNNL